VWLGCSQGEVHESADRGGTRRERERSASAEGGQGARRLDEAWRAHEGGGGGAGMTMRSLHRGSVPLYLCSRPWGRRCFRLQSADRGRTKSGARLESAERGQGDERAASERGPANTVVIRALTTKNPIRPPSMSVSHTWHHTCDMVSQLVHTRYTHRTYTLLGLAPRAASIRILHVRVR
jgi:hypothetical protein